MADQRVQIIVTSTGTVTVKKEIDDIGNAGKKSASGVDLLKAAIAGIVAGTVISDIAKYSDQFVNMQNRLKLVTSGTTQLADVTKTLTSIANDTYQSLDSVATVYQRVSQATGKLGLTQQDTNNFVRQFAESVALSGASADSANAAITQFTQGLGAGALRGQDLLSVLDQLPYTAQAIATGLNTDIAGLRALAEQGKLTPQQIIDAFKKVAPNIASDFAKVTPTISQALQVLDNQLTIFAGNATAATSLVSKGILLVANNLPLITVALTPVITVFGIWAVQVIGTQFAAAVGSVLTGTVSMISAFGRLVVYMVSDLIPTFAATAVSFLALNAQFILIGSAIAIAAAAFLYFTDLIFNGGKAVDSLASQVSDAIDTIKSSLGDVGKALFGDTKATIDASPGLKKAAEDMAKGSSGADLSKAITSATATGGKDLTKGVDDGFDTALDLMNSGFNDGGQSAADKMQAGIVAGGNTAADAMSRAVQIAGSSSTTAASNGTNGAVWNPFTTTITKPASTDLRNVPGTDSYYNAHQPGGSLYGQDGQFAVGGQFRVGGSGGTDSQVVSFRASPNERVTIDTPQQAAAKDASKAGSSTQGDTSIQSINVLDGASVLNAINTAKGKKTVVNLMKFNREEFRAVLGVNN